MVTSAQQPIPVYLRQDQLDALQALTSERGLSLDELIQEWIQERVDALLQSSSSANALVQSEASEEPEVTPAPSLDDIMGMFDSGLGDLARNHDKYLVEALEAERHRWPEKSS